MRGAVAPAPSPVHGLADDVRLTKSEAFAACQALADADRLLLRAGHRRAARALGDLFELLEERLSPPRSDLSRSDPSGSDPPGSDCSGRSGSWAPDLAQSRSGSNSSDSELTQ